MTRTEHVLTTRISFSEWNIEGIGTAPVVVDSDRQDETNAGIALAMIQSHARARQDLGKKLMKWSTGR